MAFGLFMRSRQKANVATLYLFTYGTAYYAITDADRPIVYGGRTFMPAAIKHGDIVASGSLDNATLEVTTHRRTTVSALFQSYPPTTIIVLDILKMQRDDPDQQAMRVWFGEVKSAKFEKSEVKFSCEPAATRLMSPGIRRHFQIGCSHILFGTKCKVVKANYRQEATVSTIVGRKLTLVGGWNVKPIPQNMFLNGYLEWAGSPNVQHDARPILRVYDANTFLLGGIPLNVEPGSRIAIYPGCNHQKTHCENYYKNIGNYGGFPSIPFSNPVGVIDNFN